MLRRMMMASAPLAPSGDLAAAILADSPWAYYKLDEPAVPAPTVVADASGAGRALTTLSGPPTFGVPGLFPGASTAMRTTKVAPGSRVGSGNNTYGPAIQAAFDGDKAIALMAVVKPAVLGGVLIHIGNYQLNDSQGFWLSTGTDGLIGMGGFTGAWTGVYSAPGAISAGVAHILHATRSVGGAIKVYVDGVQVAAGTIAAGFKARAGTAAGGMRISIGSASTSTNLGDLTAGDIQHAAIFAAALTPERVLAHAQAAGFA